MEICCGAPGDIDAWMALVEKVSPGFPGLETEAERKEHRQTVLGFMAKGGALCVKKDGEVAGVLLFSETHNMICCLAVGPAHRRCGVASALLQAALARLDRARDITVTTFRAGDAKGTAPRALYKKFCFAEGPLVEEFGYPNQVFVLHP